MRGSDSRAGLSRFEEKRGEERVVVLLSLQREGRTNSCDDARTDRNRNGGSCYSYMARARHEHSIEVATLVLET